MADYLEIQGTVPADVEDDLAESLSGCPVLGVHVAARDDDNLEVGVWVSPGDELLIDEIRGVLSDLGSPETRLRGHAAGDWTGEWRRSLSAFEVGLRWWIDPHPGCPAPHPPGRLRLALEPRSAFGSGTHESTQLVLMELEELDCRDRSVLDLGTGSGLLAVAADRLGARTVVAVDTDPIAAWEARSTAAGQSWICDPLAVAGGVDCLSMQTFDLILCNMILTEFSPLLPDIRRLLAPGGVAVFSGMLECERGSVESILDECGLAVAGQRQLNGWISVRATRPGGSG